MSKDSAQCLLTNVSHSTKILHMYKVCILNVINAS